MAYVDYHYFNPNGSKYNLGIRPSDIVGAATSHYNCHGYSWHLTEGNTNEVWINDIYHGIYYLHIYDGINDQPEVQKIVVKR